MGRPTALLTHGGPLRGLFLCLGILATRKRVHKLLQTHLICYFIFLQLVLDVLLYLLFVSSHRINVISPGPEMPISIFVFEICVPVENHQAAFSFEISHDLCYTVFWRDTQQHMNVVWACLCFYNFHTFLFAQLSQNLSDILFDLTVYYHPTVFRCKYYMILASPCRVLQCFDFLLFHVKRPPGFIVAVGRPQLYSTRRSFSLYNLFTLPGIAGGCPYA